MSNIHIKIDTIPGGSTIGGFEDQIQVDDFSWRMVQPTSFKAGSGGTTGRVEMGDFFFNHKVDKATPKLMVACCSGQHISEAVLTCRKAGGDSSVDFLKITLTDVVISSVSPSGKTDNDTPMEAVSMAFAQFKIEYQDQDTKSGAKKGGPVVAGFNIQKNTKSA